MKRMVPLLMMAAYLCDVPAQGVSTKREIYDFEIGDQFHFRYKDDSGQNGKPPAFYRHTILDKSYNTDSSVVYYKEAINSFQFPYVYPNPIIYYNDTVVTSYDNLDSAISAGIDTVYSDSAEYGGRRINMENYNSCDPPDDTTNCFEPYGWSYKYANGLGFVYSNVGNVGEMINRTHELVWYRKGNEEWGDPVVTGVDQSLLPGAILRIYPNPFTSHTTLETGSLKSEVRFLKLYSLNGQLLREEEVGGRASITLHRNGLPAGMYFVEVAGEKGVIGRGKVVVQ